MLPSRLPGLLLVLLLLCSCTSNRPYADLASKNLSIHTLTNSGVTVSLDIYHVSPRCQASYQGTVNLENGKTRLGLPGSQLIYLVFRFQRSGFWSNRNSVISSETLLRPRRHYRYQAEVRYSDDIITSKSSNRAPPAQKLPKSPNVISATASCCRNSERHWRGFIPWQLCGMVPASFHEETSCRYVWSGPQ